MSFAEDVMARGEDGASGLGSCWQAARAKARSMARTVRNMSLSFR
jgi:hypothetical protein